jgi:hypothetical protein
MSYDLYLKPRTGSIDAATVLNYFRERPKYTVEGEQAGYENDDTGVQFFFEINHGEPGEPEADYPILFNLAYFRPSFFVLEAEPEVTAFVRAFDCVVLDPQTDGMGQGEYRSDKLLDGWNFGNEYAYAVILQRQDDIRQGLVTLPTDKLRDIWRWNYEREKLQEQVGDVKFVPIILLLFVDGRLSTAISWEDGLPMIFPSVDFFLTSPKEPAPHSGQTRRHSLVSWREGLAMLAPYMRVYSARAFVLDYDAPPEPLASTIRGLTTSSDPLFGATLSAVLDREIVDKVVKQR